MFSHLRYKISFFARTEEPAGYIMYIMYILFKKQRDYYKLTFQAVENTFANKKNFNIFFVGVA